MICIYIRGRSHLQINSILSILFFLHVDIISICVHLLLYLKSLSLPSSFRVLPPQPPPAFNRALNSFFNFHFLRLFFRLVRHKNMKPAWIIISFVPWLLDVARRLLKWSLFWILLGTILYQGDLFLGSARALKVGNDLG